MSLSFVIMIALCILHIIISGAGKDCKDKESCIDHEIDHNDDGYDILIIGAGITGLAHSHLLSTLTDNNYKTLTVERFNRICGRTHSSTLEHDGKSITFEHGAMRFYYNEYHQKFLHRLNLCENIVNFTNKNFGQINPESNYLYRNKLKRNASGLIEYFSKLYNIKEHEREWMDDADLPRKLGYNQILEENEDKECKTFWSKWTLRGILVKDWTQFSFWKNVLNVSMEYLNYEDRNGRIVPYVNIAEMFLEYTEKYNVADEVCNGKDSFPISSGNFAGLTVDDIDQEGGIFWDESIRNTTNDRKYYTLDIGYDSICKRLYENITGYNFNSFLFEHNVIAIDKQQRGRYQYEITLQNVYNGNEIKKVYANKIISTIAPEHLSKLLENINFGGRNTPKYNDYIENSLLKSVFVDESYKLSLIYDAEWWKEAKLNETSGHLLTDNNIQTFLMEDSWTNNTLTVVHFYAWGRRQSHLFHKLQELGSNANKLYIPHKNIKINNENTLLLSSSILVNETVKQLRELTEIDIPLPLAAYSSPLGHNFSHNSGVYQWRAGYNPDNILNNIIKPIKNEDFYIATSSISPNQGWMYGGIWATIKNLKDNFGVKDPLLNEPTCQPDPNSDEVYEANQ